MKLKHFGFFGGLFCVVLLFALIPVCLATGRAPENVNCDAKIRWEIDMSAQITQFDCALGKIKGSPSLIFTVGIENVSHRAQRYRVNIFLEDVAMGAGCLVPQTGRRPVLAPGKSMTVKIPFIRFSKKSKKILVLVKTVAH